MILWLLAAAGCVCSDPVNGRSYFCFGEVSRDEEGIIGAQYAPNFLAQAGGRYPDKELFAYLEDIVIEKMAKQSHRPDLHWTFEILNTSQPNAFALPGGRVFITRGLLLHLDSEAQFAQLMGHEIGHVNHRHFTRGQGRNAVLGILVGIIGLAERAVFFLAPDPPRIISGAVGTVGLASFSKFSRDQELQSDQRGVDYALEAGYDPREGAKTFKTFLELKKKAGQEDTFLTGLLSTHPLDEERIEKIEKYIRKKYPDVVDGKRELIVSHPPWAAHRDRLRRIQKAYDKYDQAVVLIAKVAENGKATSNERLAEARSLIVQAIQEAPDHATLRVGLAVIHFREEEFDKALAVLDKAILLDEKHFQARLFRGMVHMGQNLHLPALTDLELAHELFPMNPLPLFFLGNVSEKLEKKEHAIQYYDMTIERAPHKSEIWKKARDRLEVLR
ncbi:MAG: M48 family metalloprotease [Planctomycetota bacterium]|nr:M48 family metalloprotease [Planctomycetota bacterium]